MIQTPKRQHLYNLTDKGFECIHKMPELNPLEIIYIDTYNKCNGARDGMSGALNYSVLIDVAKTAGIKDFDDLLSYANEMESLLREKRESKKG